MDASRGQHDDGSQDEQLDNNRPGSSEFVRHYSRGTDALSVASVAAEAVHESHKQHLGLAALVCLIFLEVCGGPFGSEVRQLDLPADFYCQIMSAQPKEAPLKPRALPKKLVRGVLMPPA